MINLVRSIIPLGGCVRHATLLKQRRGRAGQLAKVLIVGIPVITSYHRTIQAKMRKTTITSKNQKSMMDVVKEQSSIDDNASMTNSGNDVESMDEDPVDDAESLSYQQDEVMKK